MSQKSKRSFGIIIRRFLAGFLLFSIVMGLIEDITSGNFSRTSMDGFALGLIIVFFLAFYSRKNNKSKKVEFEDETIQPDNELLEEIDIVQDEEIQISTENLNFENFPLIILFQLFKSGCFEFLMFKVYKLSLIHI